MNTIDFAVDVAKEAGHILMDYFGKDLTRKIKRDENDFATEADIAAEELILMRIQEKFPQDAIVAEESGKQERVGAEYTWIVDPLDGTKNFANGKKDFGVFVCRCKGEALDLAVAFNPASNLLATATLDGGTFLNGERINLSDFGDDEAKSFSANAALHATLQSLGTSVSKSSALVMAQDVLQGKHRGYAINVGLIWDFVVPALLLSEAGWKVTDFFNKPYVWNGEIAYGQPGIIAAPSALHGQLVQLLVSK